MQCCLENVSVQGLFNVLCRVLSWYSVKKGFGRLLQQLCGDDSGFNLVDRKMRS